MKPKFLISFLFAFMVLSCQDQFSEPTTNERAGVETTKEKQSTLSVNNKEVSVAIQNLLNSATSPLSRTSDRSYTIVAYPNNEEPLLYIINFENDGGFVLLSATKALDPVLAYAEEGNFSIKAAREPLIEWLGGIEALRTEREAMPTDSLFSTIDKWYCLAGTTEMPDNTSISRSASYDDLSVAIQTTRDARDDAEADGAFIYYPGMQFCDDAKQCNDMWEMARMSINPEWESSWQSLCFVAKKSNQKTNRSVPNFLNTKWGQQSGFNRFYPTKEDGTRPPAGCVPVAMAQMMYFHKYPSKFEWNKMSLTYSDDYNAALLWDIAQKAGTQDGGTDYHNYVPALQSYGYNAIIYDYNYSQVLQRIEQGKRPILLRGPQTNGEAGHAWLTTGCKDIDIVDSFTLYYVSYSGDYMNTMSAAYKPISHQTSLYMNWGWYGSNDGYYTSATPYGYSFRIEHYVTAEPKK